MSVWCRVRIRDLSRLVSWWVAALCLAILRPLRKLWLHVDNRFGHVFVPLFGCCVQLRLVNLRGQKRFFLWLPIYWAVLNFKI